MFVSRYLLTQAHAEKDGFSWVEPLKTRGLNLFEIDVPSTEKTANFGGYGPFILYLFDIGLSVQTRMANPPVSYRARVGLGGGKLRGIKLPPWCRKG